MRPGQLADGRAMSVLHDSGRAPVRRVRARGSSRRPSTRLPGLGWCVACGHADTGPLVWVLEHQPQRDSRDSKDNYDAQRDIEPEPAHVLPPPWLLPTRSPPAASGSMLAGPLLIRLCLLSDWPRSRRHGPWSRRRPRLTVARRRAFADGAVQRLCAAQESLMRVFGGHHGGEGADVGGDGGHLRAGAEDGLVGRLVA
jgi:hypothetical protein